MSKMIKIEGSIKDTDKPLPPSANGTKKESKKSTPTTKQKKK